MSNALENRKILIETLREELVGPSSDGKELDCSKPLVFGKRAEAEGSWKQMENSQEILKTSPILRYGCGVLHPV